MSFHGRSSVDFGSASHVWEFPDSRGSGFPGGVVLPLSNIALILPSFLWLEIPTGAPASMLSQGGQLASLLSLRMRATSQCSHRAWEDRGLRSEVCWGQDGG